MQKEARRGCWQGGMKKVGREGAIKKQNVQKRLEKREGQEADKKWPGGAWGEGVVCAYLFSPRFSSFLFVSLRFTFW